jgi:RNA polymerase sigma factor (TIGR02999 family)
VEDITQLLVEWSRGNRAALDRLMPAVYTELRSLAKHYMSLERPDHTLQATALVHEVYLRLVDQRKVTWQGRNHFFGVAAKLMRRILVDHAKTAKAEKRGGGAPKTEVSEETALVAPDEKLLALDEALSRLEAIDPRKTQVVELKFFGGMNTQEAAEFLGISTATVERDWTLARAWLNREMAAGN